MMSYNGNQDSLKLLIDNLLEYPSLEYSEKSNLYIHLASYHEDRQVVDSAIFYATLAAEIDSIHQDSSSIPYTFYDLGNYQEGDVFKIIRCGTKILYHFKGMLIHAVALNDNNFEMYGELQANTTAGEDFKALVNFHPLL